MRATVVHTVSSTLPPNDLHPYRTGAWTPNHREWDATDLDVVEGAIPDDLAGVYLRNTENPVHDSIGLYHPFDGDGMVHQIAFANGAATYCNRFVQTDGLRAEQDAAQALWTGLFDRPENSKRGDGWGARGRMKDASSTDIVVHNGVALTTFYQCGDVYQLDPCTLADLGKASWAEKFPSPTGISAHPKLDERTGELLVFGYGTEAPYMQYGVVNPEGQLVHAIEVPLPGPRLPHDMAFTEKLRHPQRHAPVLGPCSVGPRRLCAEVLSGYTDTIRRGAAAGGDGRHPLVRSRPNLRVALDQRLRRG